MPRSKDTGSWGVRIFGILAFGAGFAVFIAVPPACGGVGSPACPGYAFGEPWVLRVERGGLATAAALFVAAILWYTVVKGIMPSGFSLLNTSATFPAEAVKKSVGSVDKLAKKLRRSDKEIAENFSRLALLVDDLESRVDNLESQ